MLNVIDDMIEKGFADKPADLWPKYDNPSESLDRTQFVSASEVGTCLRKIAYGKSPDKYPLAAGDNNYGFAQRGHTAEAWIVEQIRRAPKAGYNFFYIGDDQRSFYDGCQSGTPDGVLAHLASKRVWVIDFKCIDPRTNWKKLPKPSHSKQISQNMDLIDRCLSEKLGWYVEGGLVLYIDASNYQKRQTFAIPYDEKEMERLQRRAESVMDADTPEDLPAEGIYNGDCTYCPFTDYCNGAVTMSKKQTERAKEATNVASRIF